MDYSRMVQLNQRLLTGSTVSSITGHSSSGRAVAIAPNGKQAVSASENNGSYKYVVISNF